MSSALERFNTDLADQLALRAQLETATRDRLTWRGIAIEAIHSLAAAYDRIAQLETQKAEMRAERERYARSVWPDAALREQP